MQTARPVDHGVRLLVVQTHGAAHGTAGVDLAEVEQPVEHGAVLRAVEPLQLAHVLVLVIGGDQPQKLYVLVAVELRHVLRGRQSGAEQLRGAVRCGGKARKRQSRRSRRSREQSADSARRVFPSSVWRRWEKTETGDRTTCNQSGKCRARFDSARGNRFGKTRVIDRASYLHLLVDAVVEQEVVGHAHAVGLHGVPLAVVEVAHIRVVEVRDLLLARHRSKTFAAPSRTRETLLTQERKQDWSGCAGRGGESALRRRREGFPVRILGRPEKIAPLDERGVRGASRRAPRRIRDAIPPRPAAGDGINFPAGTPGRGRAADGQGSAVRSVASAVAGRTFRRAIPKTSR